jgi:hypothetical protein
MLERIRRQIRWQFRKRGWDKRLRVALLRSRTQGSAHKQSQESPRSRQRREQLVQLDHLPAPGPLLDALLESHKWMVRRKDGVKFTTQRQLRRSHSWDFFIPDCVVKSLSPSVVIPLGFWWKATDRYFDIDFVDETGQAIALHRMTYNTLLTITVMLEFARRVLNRKNFALTSQPVLGGITRIVTKDVPEAISELQSWYDNPSQDEDITRLVADSEFMAFLELVALSALVTVKVRSDLGRRHVIKMQYTERQNTYFKTDRYPIENRKARNSPGNDNPERRSRLPRSIPRLFGLGVYELELSNAFVRTQSYHFEAEAPTGLNFTRTSLKVGEKPARHRPRKLEETLHLEDKHITEPAIATVRSNLLVVDGWLTSAIICTVVVLGVLVGVTVNASNFEAASSQNVIAVMLLIPSVAMTIVWRRVHWLVQGLHKAIRYAFLIASILVFYLAFRISESTAENTSLLSLHLWGNPVLKADESSRFTNGSELVTIAAITGCYATVLLAILLVARFHADRLYEYKQGAKTEIMALLRWMNRLLQGWGRSLARAFRFHP